MLLLIHDLILDVLLLSDEPMLTHHLFVEDGCLLLEARFKESLSHHLDDLINDIVFKASKFYPLSGETWANLHTVLEVEPIVLGAAVYREKELTHPHLVAASIFEDGDDDEDEYEVDDNDKHWCPIVSTHTHSNRNGNDKRDESTDT